MIAFNSISSDAQSPSPTHINLWRRLHYQQVQYVLPARVFWSCTT